MFVVTHSCLRIKNSVPYEQYCTGHIVIGYPKDFMYLHALKPS